MCQRTQAEILIPARGAPSHDGIMVLDRTAIDNGHRHGCPPACVQPHLTAGLVETSASAVPSEVDEAVTATLEGGRSALRQSAPRSGRWRVSYDADVICLNVNLLGDLSVFARGEHITASVVCRSLSQRLGTN